MSRENEESSSPTAANSESGRDPAESGHGVDVNETSDAKEAEEKVEEEVEQDDHVNEAGGVQNPAKVVAGVGDVRAKLLSFPPHGSQVYLGGIPHDASAEDLKAFCEHNVGEVTKVRLPQKEPSKRREYCFVTFRSVELASKAMKELNGAKFKGKKLTCSNSQESNRLFVGNVPRRWGEEELRKAVTEVGIGVTKVELVEDMNSAYNNRGFAFVDYYNRACADYSRQKMMDPTFKLGKNAPTVSWAVHNTSAEYQVKALHVTNLPENVTEDQLGKLFEHHGTIINVVIPPAKSVSEKRSFGLVNFAERSSAMKALKNNERYELHGHTLYCELARPRDVHKYLGSNTQQNSEQLPSCPPHLSYYGLAYPGYVLGARYEVTDSSQPLTLGRTAIMTPVVFPAIMMPTVFPDGRIGYTIQEEGLQLQTPPSYQGGETSGGGQSGSENVGS